MRKFLAVVLICVMILPLCACAEEKPVVILKEEDIRAVCELATLECFYNNVAKIDKKAPTIFQVDRKMWIEHEGIATIGVDMRELVVDISGNTITMVMPKAKILSIKPNEKTLTEDSYVASPDSSIFPNKITVEDQQYAIAQGEIEMENAILNNAGLFDRAERRAKKLIENFILQMGELVDQEYTVVWGKPEE